MIGIFNIIDSFGNIVGNQFIDAADEVRVIVIAGFQVLERQALVGPEKFFLINLIEYPQEFAAKGRH